MKNSVKSQVAQSIREVLSLNDGLKALDYTNLSEQERSRYDLIVKKTFLGQIELIEVEGGFAACRKMPNRTMLAGCADVEAHKVAYEKNKERRMLHVFADSNEAILDCYHDMKRRVHWLNREYTDHAKLAYFWMTEAEKIMKKAEPFTDAEWDKIVQALRVRSKLSDLRFSVASEKSSDGYSIIGFADEIVAFLVVALRLGELAFLTAFSLLDMQEFDAIGSMDFYGNPNALDEFTERTERLHAKFEADFEVEFHLNLEDFEGFESQVWFGSMQGVEHALEMLNDLILEGVEYPEAEFRTLKKFKNVTQDELRKAYDAQ